jgi:hypothetical protein
MGYEKGVTMNLQKIKCWFGYHDWDTDDVKTNGYYWRFCKHCIGSRQASRQGKLWRYF